MWQQYSPSIKMLGSLIRAKADSNKCLGLANSQLQDGSRVQVFDCGRSEVQKWIVDLSAGMPAQIRIAETNFCLDRGMDPVEVGIWTCHDASESAPQQYWVYDPSSGMIVTDFTPNGNIVSANSALNGSPVQMTGIGGVQAGVNTIYLVYWTVG
ncbi:hypothetical protein DL96DRAFT_1634807 [Flagelloscypha sp. PMI_526]|nr:hypothetical protein DL96DRAFT_1634807 [Flagelloscypha sp. PMI_526]